ncbi:hypothetical protein HUN03_00805 [Mycoplasmopsis anatis]|uniref:hypothetical protein n=1 Tax=Mycoplasmopsis anatis TaxID=171279 RepID=UPI001C4E0A18|nr:hypothetical protein [Mycoplasmopsis anatis]MBW0595014.1 hypothetical protein [Mycoplasmopsis anatis]MBW0601588.1 hypothetical protein [Mycoplasmopsis anatis]
MKRKNSLFYVHLFALFLSTIIILSFTIIAILYKTVLFDISDFNKSIILLIVEFILLTLICITLTICFILIKRSIYKITKVFNINDHIKILANSAHDNTISRDVYNILGWNKNKLIVVSKYMFYISIISWTVLTFILVIYTGLIFDKSLVSSDPLFYVFGLKVNLVINKLNLFVLIHIILEIVLLTIFNFINNKYKNLCDSIFEDVKSKVNQYRENPNIVF